MHYTGMFVDGTVFDSSRAQGQTFDSALGKDGIIPGRIEMVIGMSTGEVRKVIILPGMAYFTALSNWSLKKLFADRTATVSILEIVQ